MKRLLRATEMLAWGVFFAFAALVLALRFWVLPDIERYREHIVSAMSRGVGLPVRVGRIEAGWLGLRPQITLSDVRIHDAQGREALVLPSVHNVVAWRSLAHGELRLHQLTIEGLRLNVRRDAAGELYVAGSRLARGGGSGGPGLGGWLLGQSEIVVRNAEIEWQDEMRAAPPLRLSALDLRLVSSGTALSLGLTARPPAELGTSLEVRALVEAAGAQPAGWKGRVFLQVGYTDLAAWRPWVDYPFDVRHGQGALRVWSSVEQGEVKAVTADLALSDVWVALGDELSPLELASLQGRVHGRALSDGVELSGKRLALVMAGGPEIPQTDFQIVWRPAACWPISRRAGGWRTRTSNGPVRSTRSPASTRARASANWPCGRATTFQDSVGCPAAWRHRRTTARTAASCSSSHGRPSSSCRRYSCNRASDSAR
jgi:uncharacterized protein YhdP